MSDNRVEWGTGEREAFLVAYIEAALWASLDDEGAPLDENYDETEVSADSHKSMTEDCADFISSNIADLAALDPGSCGHDFWLSRNGHGTGFWDRGYGDRGNRLHSAAKVYGSSDLYVGDDGQLHVA